MGRAVDSGPRRILQRRASSIRRGRDARRGARWRGSCAGLRARWVVQDVDDLARRFSDITMTPRLRLRLGAPDRVVRPNFLVDVVRARLICTYFGRGAVAAFRLLHWLGHETTGAVQRSPQTWERRLVLVVDRMKSSPGNEQYDTGHGLSLSLSLSPAATPRPGQSRSR